ncbi:MAG: ribosome-binding factor A [Candidatus Pacebacteria bacterium]|nr:ribosome-binding factor A [Candidatus Paceibacterota bacterium]
MDNRHERMQEALREVAAEFLVREAGRESLITVTRAELSDDNKRGIIYITVLPDSAEEHALSFANRNRTELGDFFKKRVKSGFPRVEFVIDKGEKNRQRLDELS